MSNPEDGVIDEIDQLVDESLARQRVQGRSKVGEPECRCGRAWHGLPKPGCPGSYVEEACEEGAGD